MALKIWLPLISDIKNIGVSDTTITLASGNSLVTSGGKIGSGALKLTARQMLSSTALYGSKQISWAFWVKVNTAWTDNWLDSIYWITSDGSATDSNRSEFYTNCTKVGMWYKGGSIAGKDYIPGGWAHFAGTVDYETGKAAFYIDGVLQGATTNADTTRYVTSVYIGDSGVDICENDVRIYDHILSPAEVKEISRGLVLHYKLDGLMSGSGINLMLNTNAEKGTTYWGNWATATNRSVVTLNGKKWFHFTASAGASAYGGFYQDNVTTSNQLVIKPNTNYTISALMFASDDTKCRFWYHIRSTEGGANITQNTKNITVTSTPQIYSYTFNSGSNSTYTINRLNMMIGAAYESSTDHEVYFTEVKLEEGINPTSWTPAPSEMGIDSTKIEDSSGYNHNGTTLNTVQVSSDSPRYNASTNLVNANSMINCGRGGMVTDSITVNLWIKSSAWGNPVSCTEGGGWNFEASGDYFRFPVYISSVGYKYGQTAHTRAQVCNNQWHMLTGVYDRLNQKVKIYVDGELDNEVSTGSSNNIGYNGSNVIWLGAEATGSATAASNGMAGLFSDFRIYCTPLLDTDIKQLYNVSMKVDNLGGIHSYELEESGNNRITKTGILEGNLMGESEFSHYLKYDPNIYIEPDGSAWVRIYHHNNPKGGSFSSTNDFVNGVYIDENRWFNVNVCNYIDKWELMVKGKYTAEGNEWKIRWIQDVNPMTATFAEVAVANITKITNSGGELYGSSPSAWGGLYAKKGSAYLTANNGTNGNWWGAVGSYSVYQNGIPGWGTSGTITTTGFNDLYVRIDNVDFNTVNASNTKNKVWNASTFIEM